ncbi:PH domain-containing protein [Kitasatospora acidiphila]|uniref:PH domain-containing protein n=1 Tax=Kitasatospora acidiphila TaxID=2567942 RepID=UPI003C763CF6
MHTDRSGARTVPWSEIAGLRGIHQHRAGQGATGRLLGYRLLTNSGTSFVIPRIPADGHDPFTDRIVDAVRRHHRPII